MISPNGFENLQWFIGVVEQDNDPTGAGRVKVRCFGIHPPVTTGEVKTKDLPWAIPLNGTYGGMTVAPGNAEWVFGFFIDGRDAQHPFLLGTIPGFNLQQMANSGAANVNDYVKPSTRAYRNYGKGATHPAQSGENLDTTQALFQNATLKEEVPVARAVGDPELGWSEPETPVGMSGEKTTVWQSKYGDSYIEVSGDKGTEVISISHGGGSHVSIDQAGNVKLRSTGDMYNISDGYSREYTQGSKDVFINGSWTVKTQDGNATLEIQGDMNQVVHGNYNLQVGQKISVVSGGGFELNAGRIAMQAYAENVNIVSAQNLSVNSGRTMTLQSGTTTYLNSAGNLEIAASGSTHISSVRPLHILGFLGTFINGGPLGAGLVTIQSPVIGVTGLPALAPDDTSAASPSTVEPPYAAVGIENVATTLRSISAGLGPSALDDDDGDENLNLFGVDNLIQDLDNLTGGLASNPDIGDNSLGDLGDIQDILT